MQSKRLWLVVLVTGVAALVTWLLTDRDSSPAPLPGTATIPQIGDRLAQEGLGCKAVIRNEPPQPEERTAVGPVESALCSIGAVGVSEDPPVHAVLLVYEVDRDERAAGGVDFPGHALVYGDRWEVWVPERDAAEDVAAALGGELRLPDHFARSPSSEG